MYFTTVFSDNPSRRLSRLRLFISKKLEFICTFQNKVLPLQRNSSALVGPVPAYCTIKKVKSNYTPSRCGSRFLYIYTKLRFDCCRFFFSNPLPIHFILLYSCSNPHKPTTLCGFVVPLYSISMRNEINPSY